MNTHSHKYTMDLCHGPLLREILLFTWPLFCSTLLQLTFTSADHIVVGRFASPLALAAVGSTTVVTGLIVNFFMGISVGANVLAAHFYGAGETSRLKDTVHTAMAISIIGGIVMGLLGIAVSRSVLRLINTPDDVLDKGTLYMRIYFGGLPFIMIYNFGSALLRAFGDTKRALYYLTTAGIINFILNLIFVICFHMDADGVATATVISQMFAAGLVWRAIAKTDEIGGLSFRGLTIKPDIFKQIMKLGLPAGFQSISFAFANILIQSSINSFGALAMAGNTAALNIEMMVNTGSSCFHHTAISFTGQLYGGRAFERMKMFIFYCICLSEAVVMTMALTALYFGPQLMLLFTKEPVVVDWGMQRMRAIFVFYFTHGFMQVFSGTMRGIGKSFAAFIIVLFCACVFRILWILFIFPHFHTLGGLLSCFPASWLLVATVSGIYLKIVFKKELNNMAKA
jgi:putative efflux protein, MATE family